MLISWRGTENRQPIGRSPDCSPQTPTKLLGGATYARTIAINPPFHDLSQMAQKAVARMRIGASVLAPISYVCLVSGLVPVGAVLNLFGQALITPFAVKNRAWDMVALSIFFTAVNLTAVAPHAVAAYDQLSANSSASAGVLYRSRR